MGVEIAIFTAVIIGVVAGLMLENYRRKIEPEPAGPAPGKVAPLRLTGPGAPRGGRVADSAADLRLVSDAGFASKPLLSGREADVLGYVETVAAESGQGWRVVPQVRLVDIIASADAEANAVIGEHRLDMLIVSARHLPVAALDYQPLGQLKDDSALRDAIKREALRRADIPFIEIRANEPLDDVKAQLLRLAAAPAAPKAPKARPAAAKPVAAKAVVAKAVTVKAVVAKPAAAKPAAAKPVPAKAVVVKPAAVKPPEAKVEVKPAPVKAAAAPKPAKPMAKPAARPVAKAVAKPAPAPVTASAPVQAAPVKPAPVKPAPAKAAASKPAAKPAPKPAAKPAVNAAAKVPKPAPKAKPAAKDPPAEP